MTQHARFLWHTRTPYLCLSALLHLLQPLGGHVCRASCSGTPTRAGCSSLLRAGAKKSLAQKKSMQKKSTTPCVFKRLSCLSTLSFSDHIAYCLTISSCSGPVGLTLVASLSYFTKDRLTTRSGRAMRCAWVDQLIAQTLKRSNG